MNPVLFLGIYTLFCGLSIAATGDEFNLGNDISITHDLTSSSEEENVEVYSKEVAGSAAERYPVRYSAPSADSRITSPDERSTERNTKQKRQRRKKLRLEGAHAAESNQTRRIKSRRKKIKNRNRGAISQPAANQSSKSDKDEGYPPSSPRSSNEINSEAPRRKSRKYGQMRRKVQYSEMPVAQDSPGSVQNVETNSVSLENSSNQDEDIEMQMKQKTKVSRGGKRREKIRLRDQKRRLRLVAREEKRRLLQEKREARRRRKLERMEKQKDLEAGRENAGEHQRRKKKKNPKNGTRMEATGNFMAAPSIDYFVEKSSNYVDTNDSPPFEVIGVSVESPSRAIVSSEAEADTAPGKLQKEKVSPVPPADEIVEHHQKVEEGITIEGDVNFTDSGDRREDGDLSCLRDDFQPAPEVAHADIKYLRNDEEGKQNPVLEAEYICHHGYKLQFDSSGSSSKNRSNIYCRDGRWVGYPPSCVRIKDLTAFNETCNYPSRCEQLCYVRNGVEKCACHKGFRLKDNRCQDVNECMGNKSLCEFECINTVGSYRCKCPKGLKAGDARSCIDINECLLRNGHGPCQDTCINTWGGYKCSCDGLPGSRLSPDGHSCVDDDECSVNNGGCSHTCLNTMGRAFCLCPEGWVLDKDWKTCVDVDECAEQYADSSEQRCEFGCINTPGSYSCLVDFGADQPIHDEPPKCPDGYYRNSTTEDCQDINECSENNGGCFHRCVNTIGSFHCSCQPGFVFGPDKHTCIAINSSTDVSCPPLFPPKHGYLECSRPIASDIIGTDANGLGGRQRITNRPGSQCVLRCPTGFRISGKFSKQCSTSGIWIGESEGTCIRYPTPKLICPPDIVLETPPNETMVKLRMPRPKTDVNYDRDVSISPGWLRNSEVTLEVGTSNITYTARHPVSKLSVSCTFTVTVLEGEPPIVKFCPETQKYTLSKQHDSIKIAWNEPIFWDNVNVTEISRTNSPGNSFGVGSHQIVYVAKDQAGYVTRCVFKILVNVPYRPTLNHPLPIYHMFYK